MPTLLRYWRSASLVALTLTIVGFAALSEAADPPAAKQRPLCVALFPYVPDQKLIQEVIARRWKERHPDIPLEFVDGAAFDSYKQDPPDDLDVFEIDAIGLDYYARNAVHMSMTAKRILPHFSGPSQRKNASMLASERSFPPNQIARPRIKSLTTMRY